MALTRFCRWTLLCRPPLLLEPYLSQRIEVMEKLNYLIQTRQKVNKRSRGLLIVYLVVIQFSIIGIYNYNN